MWTRFSPPALSRDQPYLPSPLPTSPFSIACVLLNSTPLPPCSVCVLHLTNSSFVATASILSHVLLCSLAWTIGAVTVAPFKFWWWAAGFTFMSLIALQLRSELLVARASSPASARYAGTMAVFALVWGLVFSLVWLLGQEGAAVMSRALETCLLVLADLALKAGMFSYILFAVESPQDAAGEKELKVPRLPPLQPPPTAHPALQDRLLSSSRYSTECI
jgi:bacteriorhodopsin